METATVSQNTLSAINRLGRMTRGRFDVWMLAGSHLAASRAIVMSDLLGYRVPQSKAGVNALREAFYQALSITGTCEAHREDNFHCVCVGLTQGGAQ